MNAFETDDKSLGAIEVGNGKMVKVTIAGGRKALEKVDVVIDEIADLIPLGKQILNKIISIFNSITYQLPCVLIIEGVEYIKTEQIAWGSAVDKIFYLSDKSVRRYYEMEAPTIAQARAMMRKKLREDNWIK